MILLPTLNRISLLKKFIESYVETHASVPVWVLVDQKDFEANLTEYTDIEKTFPKSFYLRVGMGVSMGDKIREAWDYLLAQKPKWVGILNDDHYCITPIWDQMVDKLIDGTNMVSTNDGDWNFGVRVCGLTAWSMPLLEACGFPIFPRKLQHLHIDDVWKAIGESTGCWDETNRIDIAHRHAFKNEMAQDDTFKKVYDQKSWEYDGKEFKHFMEQDFKDTCLRITKLRSEVNFKDGFV